MIVILLIGNVNKEILKNLTQKLSIIKSCAHQKPKLSWDLNMRILQGNYTMFYTYISSIIHIYIIYYKLKIILIHGDILRFSRCHRKFLIS